VCTYYNSGALGDEQHLVFESVALDSLRQRYSDLFTVASDTMRSFFAQQNHMRVFFYVMDCVDCSPSCRHWHK